MAKLTFGWTMFRQLFNWTDQDNVKIKPEYLDVEISTDTYSGADSKQAIAGDLNLGAAAGTSGAGDTAFLAGEMGNVLGENLTKTHNYVAGNIGAYNVTGTNASTYPTGGVLGIIGDTTTTADGAVVAVIDGDSGVTTAGAAFKVMNNNSNASSGVNFGLDLQDAAHDGYQPVDNAFYKKAQLRLTQDVCVLLKAGVPVDGGSGTGQGTAGPGSLCIDYTNANIYVNANTSASPTWKLVTRAV